MELVNMDLLLNCLLIFVGRIVEMSAATIKTVLTVKERSVVAGLMGFFEAGIWFFVVRNALNTDGNIYLIAIAYAGGYASGIFVGSWLAKKLVHGNLFVVVITSSRDMALPNALREAHYGFTMTDAFNYNKTSEKFMIMIDINKKDLPKLEKTIKDLDPGAYINVKETKNRVGGYYSNHK